MDNQKEVADWLRNNVKWDNYFTLVQHVGDELNSPKLRFDKSDLFEQGIERFSSGEIEWVDEKGHDHVIISSKVKLEMKYSAGCLHRTSDGKKGFGNRRPSVGTLRLTNTLGNHILAEDYEPKYDYLLISDVRAIALVSSDIIKHNIITDDNSVQLGNNRLASSDIEFICTPEDWRSVEFEMPASYAVQKRLMQSNYLNAFIVEQS